MISVVFSNSRNFRSSRELYGFVLDSKFEMNLDKLVEKIFSWSHQDLFMDLLAILQKSLD